MARSSPILTVFLALFVAFAVADDTPVADIAVASESIDTTARMRYRPSVCYKLTKICCYSYVPCGQVCRASSCRRVKRCVKRILGICVKRKRVTICINHCYTKLCLRWRRGPLRPSTRFRTFRSLKRSKLSRKFKSKTTTK